MGKWGIIFLSLLGLLLILPVLQAQEKAQTYSGFERMVDNVKMFFSYGDKKVMLALEIREKEVNSAIVNFQEGNDEKAVNGLERAIGRLQFVQEKVSPNAAEAVRENIEKLTFRLNESGNLSEDFELYNLEEQKTELVANLVVEFNGSEGQTLKREIVRNETNGKKELLIVIDENGTQGQTKTREIVGDIGTINNQIAERVVKTEMAKGTSEGSGGLTPEISTRVEVRGGGKEEPLPEPDLNKINPDLYNPNARAPGDTIVDPDGPDGYAPGTTAQGSGGAGTQGTNNIAPAVDSNEGDA